MGTFSIWHWVIVLANALLLFGGGGKIPRLMKDFGQGINAFKKGLKEKPKDGEEGSDGDDPAASIAARSEETAKSETDKTAAKS